ncbi:UNVERIFIED_CONTAM: Retrovirus-related Pol polyprotein from transposon [Sesamum indicum]
MATEDRKKTSFVTDKGIFCYNVMPFELKNAGATYQRLVNKMFASQIGKLMEVYVDDMLVKSQKAEDHLTHLETAFAIMRRYGMKLNPNKCTFGVGGGKFLGFMISERGIEANPEKIDAILNLKSPTSVKEVQKLTAFQNLKEYLRSPPLLVNPREGDTLYIYQAVLDNAISSVLIRESDEVQNSVYYISRMLQGAEKRYTQVEKLALALVVTARKLRSYFQLIKWAVELGEFDISYQSRTAENAQVLADFMNETSSEPPQESGIWMLHVDGSANANNGGAWILIEGPGGIEMEIVVRLSFTVTNNEAEYEALILGLELAYEAGARNLEAYTDSQLVAMQIEGMYEAKEKSMIAYKERAELLMQRFDKCSLQQISRDENERADSLAKFGALLSGIRDRGITIMIKKHPATSNNGEMNTIETPRAGSKKSYLICEKGDCQETH